MRQLFWIHVENAHTLTTPTISSPKSKLLEWIQIFFHSWSKFIVFASFCEYKSFQQSYKSTSQAILPQTRTCSEHGGITLLKLKRLIAFTPSLSRAIILVIYITKQGAYPFKGLMQEGFAPRGMSWSYVFVVLFISFHIFMEGGPSATTELQEALRLHYTYITSKRKESLFRSV